MREPECAVQPVTALRQRLSGGDLDRLLAAIDVKVVRLAECVVSRGWRLELSAPDALGIHYNLSGEGRLAFAGHAPIALRPGTLVIAPAGLDFAVEVDDPRRPRERLSVRIVGGEPFPAGEVRRHSAGGSEPDLVLICGYFEATYGALPGPFGSLQAPIVQSVDSTDRLDGALRQMLAELASQEFASGVMATALLKQAMVLLLRRSLRSGDGWAERLAVFGDPWVARAYADMLDRPGAPHTCGTLARAAGLSRSAFIERFSRALGKPPMTILRDLRLRAAARDLAAGGLSVDEAAHRAGYADRSSFARAFRKTFGHSPSAARQLGSREWS